MDFGKFLEFKNLIKTVIIIFILTFLLDSLNKSVDFNFQNKTNQKQNTQTPSIIPNPDIADLTIKINNIGITTGIFKIYLFNQKDGFPFDNTKAINFAFINPTNTNTIYTFKSLLHGNYAVVVFHDNQDTSSENLNSIIENSKKYSFSNNKKINPKIPNFNQCSFSLKKDKEINISLN